MIKTKPVTKEFESGWDAIWGKAKDVARRIGCDSESNQDCTDVPVSKDQSCSTNKSGCTCGKSLT